MSLWNSADAALATGGEVTRDWEANGVSIDTRSLQPGDLFVALKDQRDGHDFVTDALSKGAAAALVSRRPDGIAEDAPLLIVDDVLDGLTALGTAARARTEATFIGVTGSAGKTSTKEMLRAVLSGQGRVHAAEKSFNNHWGVPLTLARMPADTEFAIIEIGMNHPGEIAPLARLAQLDIAIITTVAPAHLEAFPDVLGIAKEKADIFKGLMETGGVAVINADLDVSDMLIDSAPFSVCLFGAAEGADWQLAEAEVKNDCTVCRASFRGTPILFKLAVPGRHFAMNALATLAAVEIAGGDIALASTALVGWRPPAGRGKRRMIETFPGDQATMIDLIDDAYNANPASVAASIDVLAATATPGPKGRRIAILGDMKELGPTGPELHRQIAELEAMGEVDRVHTVGPLMRALHEALPVDQRGNWAETAEELAGMARELVQPGDVVIVKGSLSMNMARVVDAISKLGQASQKENEGAA